MSSPRVVVSFVVSLLLTGMFAHDANAQDRYDQRDRSERSNGRDQHGRDRDRRGGDSITIYEHADFKGRSATFDRAVNNLQLVGMNDITSSIQLRGDWVVCEHANFGGRCETIRNNVRDLRDTGLNDRISSLRPASRRDQRR